MELEQNRKIVSGYPLILNYLGVFAILIGIITLLPLFVLIFVRGEGMYAKHFFLPALFSMSIGLAVVLRYKGYEKGRLERNQDAILVTMIWIMSIFVASLPFVLSGTYTFTQAFFESTSGFSTTGLTVVNVEEAPKIFLFFRSFLQFVGGVGLVLVLTSAISDKFGMRLYSAEGHNDKLMPNLIRSARMILSIYSGYIILGMLAYYFLGMTLFDALNHSIAAVATGGFSTKALSIGYYDSPAIEIVTMVLMILGGTNFLVHLMLLKGKLKNVISHVELKLLLILCIIFIPMLVLNVISIYNGDFWLSLRIASFQFLSAVTGTGYQTIPSFLVMPSTFILGLIIVMVLGAGMGSTAGGIKQFRVALAFKSVYWNFKAQMTHKKALRARFINRVGQKTIVEKEDINQNYAFIVVYLTALVVGTLIFSGFGYGLKESLFEFASALGTVGLSMGLIHADAHPLLLWTGTVGMFLGRLEFYVVFIAIFKVINDIGKKKITT
ncbi:MAG: TrkH family potassium uptake protein [Acholeplasmataceae bacterium]